MKRVLIIILAVLVSVLTLSAQSKSETKAYNNALKKATVKGYDSFLKKYPESTYFTEILTLRDTKLFSTVDTADILAVEAFIKEHSDSPLRVDLDAIVDRLNASSIDGTEAAAIFSKTMGIENQQGLVAGYKIHGIQMIAGVMLKDDNVSFVKLQQDGDNWIVANELLLDDNGVLGSPERIAFGGGFGIVKIGSERFFKFDKLNFHNSDKKVEYIVSIVNIETDASFSASFYGNNLNYPKSGTDYLIEGQDPSALSTGLVLAEEVFLKNEIASNEKLIPISEENLKVDNAIEWWYSKNPKAETTAKSLSFGLLDADNGIVKQYAAADKESSGNYRAALFDYRGQTIICAYNTKSKEYSLVWCEPQALNKNRDKLLNTIYFEKDSTLILFYYQGKTTFKIRVNLANKSVRR